ncbi:hypothetical protein [Bradyrhizobium icense]|uniref:Uncharacterized protein n=1 Tax=Bradyrhizobium icense TaxID=1274631 RepID=A0A1B1UDS0_9BRAD|nr:hypothetical protein [Bradyrhizobium icense]ANW00891.1 hypothetical protein LMTR13_12620 [Bradyrhizobium icense]
MCDYSLHAIASRPAKIGEQLISSNFDSTATRGFARTDDPNVAVCLCPGTELVFDCDVIYDGLFLFKNVGSRLARFRQINLDNANRHHDALEFANGRVVLLTKLAVGQLATVLQLPVGAGVTSSRHLLAQAEPEAIE